MGDFSSGLEVQTPITASGRPRVSVVICVIDPHPVYFLQAVQSILDQTLDDLELIIIEEPSSADGRDLLSDCVDSRVRHVMHPERTSLVQQRNRGIALAHADLIALLDADDIAEPNRLEEQVAFMESHSEVGVLGTNLRLIDPDGKALGCRVHPSDPVQVSKTLRRYNPIAQPSVMYRKKVVESAGGYRYQRYPVEDYELWCRLDCAGVLQANLSQCLVRYRIHPGGMKTTKLRLVLKGTIDIKEMHYGRSLNLRERLRILAERTLLYLPPKLVLKLFVLLSVRRRGTILDDSPSSTQS